LGKLEKTATATIHVPLKPFTINVDKTPEEINGTVTFMVMGVNPLTHPTYRVNFGDGSKELTTKDGSFTHKYLDHRTYTVTVVATNPSSSATATTTVTIMKPVLELRKLTVEVKPTNYTNPSTIKIHLGEGSDFHCVLTDAKSSQAFLNTSELHVFYLDKKLNRKPFQALTLPQKVVFNHTGVNRFHVTCSNRKNTLRVTSAVDIQVPITSFQLDHVTPRRWEYLSKCTGR
jgi:PKD repeat protein